MDAQGLALGDFGALVDARVRAWHDAQFLRRLWAKDQTLWSPTPVPEIIDRLGWLTLPETMPAQLNDLMAFARDAAGAGMRHVVLLGMGGSSLAPEVFQRIFGNAGGSPALVVLDSTHPAAVRAVDDAIDLRRALFLVSSKSGTTTETLSLFRYFWHRVAGVSAKPGEHFVAITDPETPLVRLARERGFRRTFLAPADIGGRYSALTVFGLVPAALIGVDVRRVLEQARRTAETGDPGLTLGAALGELALAGCDKVTFFTSRSLDALPSWIEQLIAESTGKDGKGIVPVVDEPPGPPGSYSRDRVFAGLRLAGDESNDLDARLNALEAAGHPIIRVDLSEKAAIGGECFRWEIAVAAAGAVLGIHPFNQPDVQLAKDLAQQAMQKGGRAGENTAARGVSASDPQALAREVGRMLSTVRPGDYVCIQAYLPPTEHTSAALREMRSIVRDRTHAATTAGYGPRFLHSTGQLHKGGPNTGVFIQLIDTLDEDVPVPETSYTFGELIRAQALGDDTALRQRGRRVLRVSLGRDVAGGLCAVTGVLGA